MEEIIVNFISDMGSVKTVYASSGQTLLDVAQSNGLDIEGACEGSMACATCHIVVDKEWYSKLPATSDEEKDMLDLTYGLTNTSRLGCQIVITKDLNGLTVKLPSNIYNLL
tara:strand:- start:15 stop:347 length:333 start_codon:yes stop_codon:yes gene_type:complete